MTWQQGGKSRRESGKGAGSDSATWQPGGRQRLTNMRQQVLILLSTPLGTPVRSSTLPAAEVSWHAQHTPRCAERQTQQPTSSHVDAVFCVPRTAPRFHVCPAMSEQGCPSPQSRTSTLKPKPRTLNPTCVCGVALDAWQDEPQAVPLGILYQAATLVQLSLRKHTEARNSSRTVTSSFRNHNTALRDTSVADAQTLLSLQACTTLRQPRAPMPQPEQATAGPTGRAT